MSSKIQKDIHSREEKGKREAGYEDLGHGQSLKMDLATEDGRGSLHAYCDFIDIF